MSVPPDQLMSLMGKGKGPAAAPPPMPPVGEAANMSDASTAPMAAPMSTPEPKLGNREGALVNLGMALDLIEQSLPALGSESEEGQKAMQALKVLSTVLGPRKGKTNELQQSEILQMLQSLPQAGGGTPESRSIASAPPVANMPPMPGMPPGGAPQPSPL
jgi:hypothetical protein